MFKINELVAKVIVGKVSNLGKALEHVRDRLLEMEVVHQPIHSEKTVHARV